MTGHKIGPIELSTSTAAIPLGSDRDGEFVVRVTATPSVIKQLKELAEHAGRVTIQQGPLGPRQVLDDSPNGENTIAYQPRDDNSADDLLDVVWIVLSGFEADAGGSTTHMTATISGVIIGGAQDVECLTQGETLFLSHDF